MLGTRPRPPNAPVSARPLPRETAPDSTLALLRDPYRFVSERCRRHGGPAFACRLMLAPAVCMSGRAASAFFYTSPGLVRRGAMPEPILATLLGRGGVQGLDGEAHAHRKRLFMSIVDEGALDALEARVREGWTRRIGRWPVGETRALYGEAQAVLAEAACAWAGTPVAPGKLADTTRDLALMFDAAAALGPRHLKSRLARRRAERWARERIDALREGGADDSPAGAVARHLDLDGRPLSREVAAVELLNLLRPTVAVAVYVVDAVHALALHPEHLGPIRAGDAGHLHRFVQEVRRFYPFFPAVAARAERALEFDGMAIPAGARVLLDLHGTCREPGRWERPDAFDPTRFETRGDDPYGFIPQGGGEFVANHRCAGEWIAIRLAATSLATLAGEMTWELPPQDLAMDMRRLPALPKGGPSVRRIA